MTYAEALSYIHKTEWRGSRLGLGRIRELLSRLGDPQKNLTFIHIAGTNGKGSVSAMLESVLREAGYRTGLFTSPFLVDFRERIRVAGEWIGEDDLARIVEKVRPAADAMEDAPTEFELMTAVAFCYFATEKCDVVVCEVGLGGELDSTNVIEKPSLSVITSIALDHTRELGDTVEQIAAAKAGIIKPGCPALFGEAGNTAALGVIRARAKELGCALTVSDPASLTVEKCDLSGSTFSYRMRRGVSISLAGAYQPENAMTVLDACDILRANGMDIPEAAIFRGMKNALWKGRFEVYSLSPAVILDGAHNPHGAAALSRSLTACFGEKARFLAVSAVMADKDYPGLFSRLFPRLDRVFAVSPSENARALSAEALCAFCRENGVEGEPYHTVEDGVAAALKKARESGLPLLIFGSLYLYREAEAALRRLL